MRCPKDITPYLEKIISLALEYIKYDPNYAEEDEGDEMETEEEGEEEEADEEAGEEENYSDDEDMSWKVRRSSAKCLAEIVSTRPEMLGEVYNKVLGEVLLLITHRSHPSLFLDSRKEKKMSSWIYSQRLLQSCSKLTI